jgi:threonylcarbamoyladenosine tRNA methylthiotransferase MtaB
MKKQGFKIITLGCKVNQSESERLAAQLTDAGLLPASSDDAMEICVINTCAVTAKAAAQSRQAARRAARDYPHARTVVIGCDARIEPAVFSDMCGVAVIDGGARMPGPAALLDLPNDEPRLSPNTPWNKAHLPSDMIPLRRRTRPFLKVQDGCDAHCSYCIVPKARGGSRSLPLEQVLAGLAGYESAGFQEVVLTGIHLGVYGHDLNPPLSLEMLLLRIFAADFKLRLRLSSIEPREVSDEMIGLMAGSEKFCRHFHIPLQSGDDTILARMGRPYDRQTFAGVIEKVASQIPDCALGVDVLVGFPGETDIAFDQTYNLIESLPVTYLHVFPFSPRPGTPAAGFSGRVVPDLLKQRCARMRRLGREKRRVFYQRFLGQQIEVLVEGTRDRVSGCLKGVSDNYLNITFDGPDELMNRLVWVWVERLEATGNLLGSAAQTS